VDRANKKYGDRAFGSIGPKLWFGTICPDKLRAAHPSQVSKVN